MKYSILLPCEFDLDQWYNIGIDFWPQHITANHRVSGEERILVDLKKFAIQLDNRYVKGYEILKMERGKIALIVEV